mmetsp:Transcript_19245/g.28663  ORF Transcript_19245/g.28663 Transcript_19245/m.28663 type:complete len:210 (-) Transcript_19245:574-1203(-)
MPPMSSMWTNWSKIISTLPILLKLVVHFNYTLHCYLGIVNKIWSPSMIILDKVHLSAKKIFISLQLNIFLKVKHGRVQSNCPKHLRINMKPIHLIISSYRINYVFKPNFTHLSIPNNVFFRNIFVLVIMAKGFFPTCKVNNLSIVVLNWNVWVILSTVLQANIQMLSCYSTRILLQHQFIKNQVNFYKFTMSNQFLNWTRRVNNKPTRN